VSYCSVYKPAHVSSVSLKIQICRKYHIITLCTKVLNGIGEEVSFKLVKLKFNNFLVTKYDFFLFTAGSALQFWVVMFSHSPYWQNCKLCLPSFCTPAVRPSPQPGCWQWQDHQASNLVTSRTALSFWREIIIIFTVTYPSLMDSMMCKLKYPFMVWDMVICFVSINMYNS
jgi:hypothetical protein